MGTEDLHTAVRTGDASLVESLLNKGSNIDTVYYGWTPLQHAIDIGNQEVAVLLIDKGCDHVFHDKNHRAPFEEAVMKKQPKVVESLLAKGVTGNIIMSGGHTPLTYAVEKECPGLLSVLIKGPGIEVDKPNTWGHTAAYLAAKNGEVEMLKSLLSAGANANYICKEEGAYTPLIAAAANEHVQVVSALTKHGCDLNAQDADGWTALWHAYSSASEDICRVLLRAGADKSIPNAEGQTVVQDATENEDESMIELFQKYNSLV
ncbi:hypothetical protein BaRGS_00004951 [Batillaria attramentaria]|uniref:Ankyrin n=1 Tax=Batillaria attramentaria TaxID=370345 RepID=A0ABD0LWP9_9CAEN